jgi:hypothetical protein
MIIRADEIMKYMEMHGVDKVPLEAVSLDVPALVHRKARKLSSSRMIVTGIYISPAYGKAPSIANVKYTDAEHMRYQHVIPATFEFNVVAAEEGQKMLDGLVEYNRSLESRFRKVVDEHNSSIQEKLKAAAELIEQAENLSEKYAIPFRPDVSITGFSMSYIPESFKKIFSNLDLDIVRDITRAYSPLGHDAFAGWQQSQTC